MDSIKNKRKQYLADVKNIVVKVGSSTLTHSNGLLNLSHIEHLVRQLSDLHNRGYGIILVSSGAIGAGMGKLGLTKRPEDRKSTRLNSSHANISYAVFCLKTQKIVSQAVQIES